MKSMPKRWTIQPLSKKLEPTDLCPMHIPPTADNPHRIDHSMSYSKSGNSTTFSFDRLTFTQSPVEASSQKEVYCDMAVEARQVTVLDGQGNASNDWHPSFSSSQSSPARGKSSHSGFYSIVEDPSSQEAELNETWMESPQRKATLATLKEKDSFKLQTYSRGRKPQSLFKESNEDSRYQVDDSRPQAVNRHEEKQLRQQIICSQAPKQNPGFKNQWSALESLPRGPYRRNAIRGERAEIKTKSVFVKPTPLLTPVKAKEKNRVSFLVQQEIEKNSGWDKDLLNQGKVFLDLYDRETFQKLEDKKKIFGLADKSYIEEGNMTTANNALKIKTKESLGSRVRQKSGSSDSHSGLSPSCPHRHPGETGLYNKKEATPDSKITLWGSEVQNLNKVLPGQMSKEGVKLKDTSTSQKLQVTMVDRTTSTREIPSWSPSMMGTVSIPTGGSLGKDIFSFYVPSSPVSTDSSVQTPQSSFPLDSSGQQLQSLSGNVCNVKRERRQDVMPDLQGLNGSKLHHSSPLRRNLGEDVTDAYKLCSKSYLVKQKEPIESPSIHVEQTNKMAANQYYSPITFIPMFDKTNSTSYLLNRPSVRLPLSIVTAQPWGLPHATKPVYAGIQPLDDVNNEVLEATRVTRHKNMRAQRWEAGIYL